MTDLSENSDIIEAAARAIADQAALATQSWDSMPGYLRDGYRRAACAALAAASPGVESAIAENRAVKAAEALAATAAALAVCSRMGFGEALEALMRVSGFVPAAEAADALSAVEIRFHVPQIGGHGKGWGVFCAACSAAAGDYVHPCKLPDPTGWWAQFPAVIPVAALDGE